tara:strand:- start:1081 stop:1389 length:309 start_codon:yes stop_codon:yes gene_type:complete
MTDAPETIWVDPTGVDELDMYVAHASDTMDYLNMDIAYTRTDIPQARIAQLEAALAQCRGMAREGSDVPNAAYRWCERIEEVALARAPMAEYEKWAALKAKP